MSHVIVVLTPQGHVKQVIGPFVNEHTASGWARAGDDRDRFEVLVHLTADPSR